MLKYKIVIVIYSIFIMMSIFVLGCREKKNINVSKVQYVDSSGIIIFDTIKNEYYFKNYSINKKLDNHFYSNVIIMENKGRSINNGKDTFGYFRFQDNKIYYLCKSYKEPMGDNTPDMHEQLFFDFSLNEEDTIFFIGDEPFAGENIFIIKSKNYNNKYSDTVFTCLRVNDSLFYEELVMDGGGIYFIHEMKISKKAGFTELKFINSKFRNKIDVYVPPTDYSWTIFKPG